MSANFQLKKRKILEQIEVPEEEYTDLSPKGSIDVRIRNLVGVINKIDGLVTTSSCAGRISVFLEGQKKSLLHPVQLDSAELLGNRDPALQQGIAGPGGKGGGKWLFVSHDPMAQDPPSNPPSKFHELFGIATNSSSNSIIDSGARFIHFKFEAMVWEAPPILRFKSANTAQILHLLTASLADAQAVLSAASSAGFRESGAMGLSSSADGTVTPMVAVRSTGLGFDSIIGYQNADGSVNSLVTEEYLELLVNTANERFKTNTERIERFRAGVLSYYNLVAAENGSQWEDKDARKARKRAEGLARQKERIDEGSENAVLMV